MQNYHNETEGARAASVALHGDYCAANQSIELLRLLLGRNCPSDTLAGQLLQDSDNLGVEPLDFIASRYGLSNDAIIAKAAKWLNLRYFSIIPGLAHSVSAPDHLERIGSVRTVRASLLGREVVFATPNFAALLTLKSSLTPQLAGKLCLVPQHEIRDRTIVAHSNALLDGARQNLARKWPQATAHIALTPPVRWIFAIAGVVIAVALLGAPFVEQAMLLPLAILFLILPAAIRLAAVAENRRREPLAGPSLMADAALPVYTVLIPLRDEAHMVPQLYRALSALDYPVEKLDLIFVVESQSVETVAAARAYEFDPRFRVISVPDQAPRTKPKALNFALPMARGRYVVVFDAEDVPDRDQLRKAATRFENDPKLQCLQAELVIDNGDENWLAAMFAGEYAGLFSVLLPALARWGMPMPLGGTSNHFRVQTLRELGGWDSFNVTEDADLGMRLARRRMKTAMLASKTREEAPTHVGVWVKQRTRWMKGWMQTFIVHNRHPAQTVRDMGWKAFVVFEVLVGGMILAPMLHSAFLVVVITRVALGDTLSWESFTPWTALYFVIFILGYVAAWAMVLTGLHRVGHKTTWLAQAGLPIYWLLQSVATVRALNELIEKPFYWAKTEHRIRRQKSKLARESLLGFMGRWIVRLGGRVMGGRSDGSVILRRGEVPVIEAMIARLG